MTRRHLDPVEVRTRVEASGPVPDQFLWRGRLYCVREVLARWTESGSWWRGTAVHALASGGTAGPVTGVTTSPAPAVLDDRERQWWRVEADSGRRAAQAAGHPPLGGVYDLCFEERTARWSLVRVMD